MEWVDMEAWAPTYLHQRATSKTVTGFFLNVVKSRLLVTCLADRRGSARFVSIAGMCDEILLPGRRELFVRCNSHLATLPIRTLPIYAPAEGEPE